MSIPLIVCLRELNFSIPTWDLRSNMLVSSPQVSSGKNNEKCRLVLPYAEMYVLSPMCTSSLPSWIPPGSFLSYPKSRTWQRFLCQSAWLAVCWWVVCLQHICLCGWAVLHICVYCKLQYGLQWFPIIVTPLLMVCMVGDLLTSQIYTMVYRSASTSTCPSACFSLFISYMMPNKCFFLCFLFVGSR